VDHARGNGRPKKITGSASKMIGQSIRRNDSISTRTLAQKMSNMGEALSKATPMLTEAHKQRRVEWARQHLNDNWRKTLFSDETAFQLYRNIGTVQGVRPICLMPKDRIKVFASSLKNN